MNKFFGSNEFEERFESSCWINNSPPKGDIFEEKTEKMVQVKALNELSDETDIERLRLEHRELDETIKKIESLPYRSVADQTEIRRLKKIKLQKKDAIYLLMRRQATA